MPDARTNPIFHSSTCRTSMAPVVNRTIARYAVIRSYASIQFLRSMTVFGSYVCPPASRFSSRRLVQRSSGPRSCAVIEARAFRRDGLIEEVAADVPSVHIGALVVVRLERVGEIGELPGERLGVHGTLVRAVVQVVL